MIDLAIVGGGPAGLSAGLYATRGGLKNVVMYDLGMPGGQIMSSSEIENYPGVAKVMDGISFMAPWSEQCMRFGLKHEMIKVLRISKNDDKSFNIHLEGDKLEMARAVIVCTGSTPRRAGFKGEDEFFGRGVSTCATCDGFFYKGKEVAVLGGGDTALEEALFLSNLCSKVYLIHRRDEFRASPNTVARVRQNEKIELILKAGVDEVCGDNMGVNLIKIKHEDGHIQDLALPGIFTFVGLDVRNEVLKNEENQPICELEASGQVVVDLKMASSLKGLFAAGDLRKDAPKQVICAASDGAIAALSAYAYLLGH